MPNHEDDMQATQAGAIFYGIDAELARLSPAMARAILEWDKTGDGGDIEGAELELEGLANQLRTLMGIPFHGR